MTHTTRTTATTIAAAALLALTACNPTTNTNAGNNTQNTPATTAPSTTNSDTNPATQTPEQRIRAYFEADTRAAADGWKDLTHIDKFMTPELAKLQREDDQKRAATGTKLIGERKLSHFTPIEETDTKTIIEFCDNTSAVKAEKDGKPAQIKNQGDGESVARYTLTRASANKPWLISESGYYEEEAGSCADHFGN